MLVGTQTFFFFLINIWNSDLYVGDVSFYFSVFQMNIIYDFDIATCNRFLLPFITPLSFGEFYKLWKKTSRSIWR